MPFDIVPSLNPAQPNMNFSSVGGGVADQKVVESIYGYDPFAIERLAYERHGKPPTFLQTLDMMGPAHNKGASAPTIGHYEKDWLESLVKVGSIVTGADPGAGQPVIIALHADMMYDPAVNVSGVASQASYPREKQIIYFKDGKKGYITLKNTTVNPHRLTITPTVAAESIFGSIVAANSYFISDNAWAHGSGLPVGVMPRVIKYTNKFQITKEAFASTGSELTNQTFVQVNRAADGSIWAILDQDTTERFDRARSGAILWGAPINNITDATTQVGYDVAVQGTEGYIEFLENGAVQDAYTGGGYVLDDFYNVGNAMHSQRTGASSVLATMGYSLFTDIETTLTGTFANDLVPAMVANMQKANGVTYDDWQPASDKDFIAWLGFKAAHVGGFTYWFKVMTEFSDITGAGAAGYTQNQWGIFAPLNNVTERTTRMPVAKIGYLWKQLGAYSRKAVISPQAGAGVAGIGGYPGFTQATSNNDMMSCGLVSEQAFQGYCPNQFVMQKPA